MSYYTIYLLCNIETTITISKREYDALRQENKELRELLTIALHTIEELRIEIELLKNGRKSNTSSTPSSQDYTRSNRFNSRKKSWKRSGGQKGHKGSTLKMSGNPDEVQNHFPRYCKQCGEEFHTGVSFNLHERKQEIVIPPIKAKYVEHRSYSCTCSKCGAQIHSYLPHHLKANIQYGKNIQSLIVYLSVYQYMPSNRIKSYLKDIMNIPISEGTIYNIIETMSKKAMPAYETIKERIATSKVVGGDETGIRINGKKAWLWVFQNSSYTFIKAAAGRGYQNITETFSNGFPMSVYVSDSLAAQLKTKTMAKQLCLAHLIRESKNFEEAFHNEWASKLKQLFKDAISYKRQMTLRRFKSQMRKSPY